MPKNALHGRNGCLLAERLKVGANITWCKLHKILEREVFTTLQSHLSGKYAQNINSLLLVRNAEGDLTLESAGPSQRRIDGLRPARGADDNHLTVSLTDFVHAGRDLCHNSHLQVLLSVFALSGHAVELVNENDRWRLLLNALKEVSDLFLRLSTDAAHDLGAGQLEERNVFV